MSALEFLNPLFDRRLQSADLALAEARLRHPALSAHESVASMIRALHSQRPENDATNPAIVGALLLEAQGGVEAMWVVLIHAFFPLLGALRRTARRMVTDEEALWPLLLEAFVEAVAAYPGPGVEARPSRFLRRETERRFVRDTRRLRRSEERLALVTLGELDGDSAGRWESPPPSTREPQRFRADLAVCAPELAELLRKVVGGQVPEPELALVEATVLGGEELVAYVERRYQGQQPKERRRSYFRLQQQRFRTMKTLRRLLAPWRAEVLAEEAA